MLIAEKSLLFGNQYFKSLLYMGCYLKKMKEGIFLILFLGVKQQSFEDAIILIYRSLPKLLLHAKNNNLLK